MEPGSVFSFSLPLEHVEAPRRLTPLPYISHGLIGLRGKASRVAATRYVTDAGLRAVDVETSDEEVMGASALLIADADQVPALRRRFAGNDLKVIAIDSAGAMDIDRLLADGMAQSSMQWPIRQFAFAEMLHHIVDPTSVTRPQVPAASTALPRLSNLLALVVDDSPVNREVAREALSNLGLRVEEAASGREALEAVSAKRYDVVFMDGSMPDSTDSRRAVASGLPKRPLVAQEFRS